MAYCIYGFSILLLLISSAESYRNCCSGENVLMNYKCPNRTKVNVNCTQSFIMDLKNETQMGNLLVDLEGNLFFDDKLIPEERYCLINRSYGDKHMAKTREAVIMCFDDSDVVSDGPPRFIVILSFFTVVFLAFTVIVYAMLPQLRDLQGICMMFSISALAVSFFLQSINQSVGYQTLIACLTISYMVFIAFLYSFFWLNVLSFHIWKSTVLPNFLPSVKKSLCIYITYTLIGPLPFLAFLLISQYGNIKELEHLHPGFGGGSCWFSTKEMTMIYFYGPIIGIISLNTIFLIWTVASLWNQMDSPANSKKLKTLQYRVKLCLKLFIIMGLTWIFEVLSVVDEGESLQALWIITDFINASEGILIFLILVVFRKKVLRGLATKAPFSKYMPKQWKTLRDEEDDDEEPLQDNMQESPETEEKPTD